MQVNSSVPFVDCPPSHHQNPDSPSNGHQRTPIDKHLSSLQALSLEPEPRGRQPHPATHPCHPASATACRILTGACQLPCIGAACGIPCPSTQNACTSRRRANMLSCSYPFPGPFRGQPDKVGVSATRAHRRIGERATHSLCTSKRFHSNSSSVVDRSRLPFRLVHFAPSRTLRVVRMLQSALIVQKCYEQ